MSYHDSRLTQDARRDTVWKALWRYVFRHRIAAGDCVLDLGCGYGEFINNVTARRRIGLDMWPGIRKHLGAGVEGIVGSVTQLDGIDDASVDFAFASNLFEHISQADFAKVLASLARLPKRYLGICVTPVKQIRMAKREISRRGCLARMFPRIRGYPCVGLRRAHHCQLLCHRPQFGRCHKGLAHSRRARHPFGPARPPASASRFMPPGYSGSRFSLR